MNVQVFKTITLAAVAPLLIVALASCSDFSNSEVGGAEAPRGQGGSVPTGGSGALPPELQKPNDGEFTEARMLANIGMNVIARGVREFKLQTELLNDRLGRYCESLDSGSAAVAERTAKEQWEKAMLAYHFIAASPVGPLSDANRILADQIYSWPYINSCGVDLEVIRLAETGSANKEAPFSQKGLAAIEYLLFDPAQATGCNARAYPHVTAWLEKSTTEKKVQRCRYAKVLSDELSENVTVLDRAWALDDGNFTKTLVDGSRYKAFKDATNELTDALFSLETLKDLRLGRPLGRHKDCISTENKCPDAVEHRWSGLGLKAVRAQLEGFMAAFFGSLSPRAKAFGLDDLLAARGQSEVAARMLTHLERAIELSDELSKKGDLQAQITAMDAQACAATTVTDRREPLCALFQDVRQVSLAMKSEVLAILSLRAPPVYQGDND